MMPLAALSGDLAIEAVSFFTATATLYQEASPLHAFTADWSAEQAPFDVSGVLAPGTYRLVVDAIARGGDYGVDEGYTGASFEFVFAVPEPASAVLVCAGPRRARVAVAPAPPAGGRRRRGSTRGGRGGRAEVAAR